jgi:hypothetical protein
MPDIPKNAYRVFTGPDNEKRLVFIDARGSVMKLVPRDEHKRLPDGYYTREFELIRRSDKPV